MVATAKSLGIDQLSREQRINLVQEIWDSIVDESPPPLTQAQAEELSRRIADDDARPDDVIPWEQVKTEIMARLHKP